MQTFQLIHLPCFSQRTPFPSLIFRRPISLSSLLSEFSCSQALIRALVASRMQHHSWSPMLAFHRGLIPPRSRYTGRLGTHKAGVTNRMRREGAQSCPLPTPFPHPHSLSGLRPPP